MKKLENLEELHVGCPLPPETCPAKGGWFFPVESVIGLVIAGILLVLGSFLIIISTQAKKFLTIKTVKLKQTIKNLSGDEKVIYDMIVNSGGSILQSDLVKKTGYSKVKVSRILDGLEVKGLVERRRRGMANMVILKL